MGPVRLILDPGTRLVDGGRVLIGGSPLRLFRLGPAGQRVAEALRDGADLPAGHERLTDRLLDAGAAHPAPEPGRGRRPSEVTAVIPARDTPAEVLAELCRRVRAEGIERCIVVDDASAVPLVAAGAALVRLATNLGPGGARNAGAAEVRTPFIAFLDADTLPEPGWLAPLLAHAADPRVALVAPRITAVAAPGALARFEQWRSPLDLGPVPARIRAGSRVSYVPAAALLVRADAFRALGGFEPGLRLGEDVDLVWRLDEAGHGCRYEPGAAVAHRTRPDLRRWVRQRFDYGTSAGPLATRHPGALAPARLSGWSVAVWVLGVLVHPVAGAAVAGGTIAALARKLRPMDHPVGEAARLAGLGNLHAGRILASAVTRAWWPLAVAAALVSRRARRAVLLAAVVPVALDWWRDRPPIDPLRGLGLRLLDDAAYGAGVWVGVVRTRCAGPLVPELANWPGRRDPGNRAGRLRS